MLKPACVKCQRFMRPKKNGFFFTEGMPIMNAEPGLKEPENWKPYKVWQADLWACPDCGLEILSGYGLNPIAEHYQSTFLETQKRLGADQLQINDC
jgi:hypothetical protein